MVDLLRRVILLDHAAVENGDLIAHAHGFGLVVGDKHRSETQAGDKVLQLVAHLFPQQGVQCRERLVKQNATGLDDDGTGKGHALLLTAGKLVRIPLGQILQVDAAQCLHHLFFQVLGTVLGAQTKGHVLKHRHVRPQRKILKDKPQPPLFRRGINFLFLCKHTVVIKPDLPAVRGFQAGDHPQQRRFTAAGGTQQSGKTAALNCQRSGRNDLFAAKGFGDIGQSNLHKLPHFILDLELYLIPSPSVLSFMILSCLCKVFETACRHTDRVTAGQRYFYCTLQPVPFGPAHVSFLPCLSLRSFPRRKKPDL